MAHDAFISYSSKDKATADAACALLEAAGVRCWIAPRDIRPGSDWGESIIDAIAGSRVMVLIFSAHANQSPQVRREVERAVNKGVVIVPFRIENVAPCKSLEYFISVPHWMDAYGGPLEKHLALLTETVGSLLRTGGREADAWGKDGHARQPAAPKPAAAIRGAAAVGAGAAGGAGKWVGGSLAVGLVGAVAVFGAGAFRSVGLWPGPGTAAAGTKTGPAVTPGAKTGGPASPWRELEPSGGPASTPWASEPGPKAAAPANSPAPAAEAPATEAPAVSAEDRETESRRREVEAEAKGLRLTSVAEVGRLRFCVLDGSTVHEGGSLRGFVVQKIGSDHVVVASNGFEFEVKLQAPPPGELNSPFFQVAPAYETASPPGGPQGGQRFYGPSGGGNDGPGGQAGPPAPPPGAPPPRPPGGPAPGGRPGGR